MTCRSLPGVGEVHLWALSLDMTDAELAALGCALSEQEKARASRFPDGLNRRRYIAGRGQLRQILAGYLGTTSDRLGFIYNAFGKPELEGSSVDFNLSHAGGSALCAVAVGVAIGVDVERVRSVPDLQALARHVMSPLEWMLFNELPPAQRLQAFYRCWTRKEAYLKARGIGISSQLQKVAVSMSNEFSPRMLQCGDDVEGTNQWQLRAWEFDGGEVLGALAVCGALSADALVWKRPWSFSSMSQRDGLNNRAAID